MPGRNVHLDESLAQQEQDGRDPKLGANATVTSNRLDGMCVNTIVLTRPMRLASHAATRCETAFISRAPKNSAAIVVSDDPNFSKKKYDTSAVVRKPPPRPSSANSAEIRALVKAKKDRDGHPVDTVRVVFLEEWMARRERRPLLDVGARVYFMDPKTGKDTEVTD